MARDPSHGSDANREQAAATPEASDQEQGPVPLDDVFDIVKNERRRLTLQYLQEQEEPVALGELAEHVAIQESDTTAQSVTSTERKRAYVGLYQVHLPKMDELGAVDYNRDEGVIELGPHFEQFEPYIGTPDEPARWPKYYLTLAILHTTLFGGWLVVGITLGGDLSEPVTAVLGAIAILSFAALALVHHRRWKAEAS